MPYYSLSPGVLKDWIYQVKNRTTNFRKLKNQQISGRILLWPFTCKHFQLYMTYYSLCPNATLIFIFSKSKEGGKNHAISPPFLYLLAQARINWKKKLSAMPMLDMVLICIRINLGTEFHPTCPTEWPLVFESFKQSFGTFLKYEKNCFVFMFVSWRF